MLSRHLSLVNINFVGRTALCSRLFSKHVQGTRTTPLDKDTKKFMVGIWKHVKERDFKGAADALLSIPDKGSKLPRNAYTGVLSICRTKDQLPDCLHILQKLKAAGYSVVEPEFLAIIRCLSHSPTPMSGGSDCGDNSRDIQRALAVLKYMQAAGEQPRSRTYMPILGAMNRQRDLHGLVLLVSEMYEKGLEVRRSAIALLLDTYALCYSRGLTPSSVATGTGAATDGTGDRIETLRMLQELLYKCNSKDPAGISGADMIKIVESFALTDTSTDDGVGARLDAIRSLGVLTTGDEGDSEGDDSYSSGSVSVVGTADSPIVVSRQAVGRRDGRVSALAKDNKDNRLRIHDVLPIKDNHYYPIPYVFGNPTISAGTDDGDGDSDGDLDNRTNDLSREAGVGHTGHISDELVAATFSTRTLTPPAAATAGGSGAVSGYGAQTAYCGDSARIVHIDALSGVCPNCGTQLHNHVLSEPLLHRIRAALTRCIIASGYEHYQELQKFLQWLDQKEHRFDIIVDGANVAYHRQKEIGKGFSYRQLMFVVQEIRKKHPDKRVLVVIPRGHYAKVGDAHRSGSYSHNEFLRSDECRDAFESWKEQGMLYTVPRGIEDDWFWLMASIATGRKATINGNTTSNGDSNGAGESGAERNCGYVLTNDGMRDHKGVFLEPKYFTRWRSTLTIQFDISRPISDDLSAEAVVWPKLKFWEPGYHSREMQMKRLDDGDSSKEDIGTRWHVPATNQNAWLCMKMDGGGRVLT